MDLKSRLVDCAEAWRGAWAAAEGADVPLSRLAKRVMDDGKFFELLPTRRYGPSTDTLEKFARYFLGPVNWPDGQVPEAALVFGHVVGVRAPVGFESPDNGADRIGGAPDRPTAALAEGGETNPEAGFPPVTTSGGAPAASVIAPTDGAGHVPAPTAPLLEADRLHLCPACEREAEAPVTRCCTMPGCPRKVPA